MVEFLLLKFVIEIAVCSPDGFTHYWGEKVLPNKVTVYDLQPNNRRRLKRWRLV